MTDVLEVIEERHSVLRAARWVSPALPRENVAQLRFSEEELRRKKIGFLMDARPSPKSGRAHAPTSRNTNGPSPIDRVA
jgi:hypothetical protein